jgi:hypothetical protein
MAMIAIVAMRLAAALARSLGGKGSSSTGGVPGSSVLLLLSSSGAVMKRS